MTVPEAGRILGMSRQAAYRAARTGHLPIVRISSHRLVVPTHQLRQMLSIPETYPEAANPPAHESTDRDQSLLGPSSIGQLCTVSDKDGTAYQGRVLSWGQDWVGEPVLTISITASR